MSGYCKKIPVFLGILLFVLFLCTAALAEGQPFSIDMAISNPKILAVPEAVEVIINMSNTSDSPMPVTITLLDPDGKECLAFGNAGTVNILQGQSASYCESWQVSQQELDAGRIVYSARFSYQSEDGQPISGSYPIAISILSSEEITDLVIQRVPPTPLDGSVVQGETVILQYQIKNTGTIDLTDITITDSNIIDGQITISRLQPGETQELSYDYVADGSVKISEPMLTYNYVAGGSMKSKSLPGVPFVLTATVPETKESMVTPATYGSFKAILAFCMFVVHANGWKGGVR